MRPLVALTGGTGFLGRHVLTALAAAGWRVRLLSRRPAGGADARLPGEVETVSGSLSDEAALARLVDDVDAVVHLAGAIRARDRAGFMAVNRDGTAALARAAAARAPGVRFVLVSSLAAREPEISHYAASKAAGERALAESPVGADAVILRPCVIYGPGDRATLPMFRAAGWPVQPVLNGPAARVALIHAADVASAVVAAMRPEMPAGTWELTDSRTQGYAWPEIVKAACRVCCGATPRPLRVPGFAVRLAGLGGDLAAWAGAVPMFTSGKAREVLHDNWGASIDTQPPAELWRPVRDLDDGFAQTAMWYRAHGWLSCGPLAGSRTAEATE